MINHQSSLITRRSSITHQVSTNHLKFRVGVQEATRHANEHELSHLRADRALKKPEPQQRGGYLSINRGQTGMGRTFVRGSKNINCCRMIIITSEASFPKIPTKPKLLRIGASHFMARVTGSTTTSNISTYIRWRTE